MGGGQGVTTTGAQTLGDSSSFINDPANMVATRASRSSASRGSTRPSTPTRPTWAILHRPSTAARVVARATAQDAVGHDQGRDLAWHGRRGRQRHPAGDHSAARAGAISARGNAAGHAAPVRSAPADGGPQGTYTSPSAQGGAAGSLQGVAATLLTSKDTFGYGKSMLA
jgi:hypothetical protein